MTCFWGVAISDPEFAAEDAGHVRSAQERIKALLHREHPDVVEVELDVVSRRLVTIVHGLGAQCGSTRSTGRRRTNAACGERAGHVAAGRRRVIDIMQQLLYNDCHESLAADNRRGTLT